MSYAFLMLRQRSKNGDSSKKTEELYHQNANKDADAVDANISDRRRALPRKTGDIHPVRRIQHTEIRLTVAARYHGLHIHRVERIQIWLAENILLHVQSYGLCDEFDQYSEQLQRQTNAVRRHHWQILQ